MVRPSEEAVSVSASLSDSVAGIFLARVLALFLIVLAYIYVNATTLCQVERLSTCLPIAVDSIS
jgi:hypothetical protein